MCLGGLGRIGLSLLLDHLGLPIYLLLAVLNFSFGLLDEGFSELGLLLSFLPDIIQSDAHNGSLHLDLSFPSLFVDLVGFHLFVHSSPGGSPGDHLGLDFQLGELGVLLGQK